MTSSPTRLGRQIIDILAIVAACAIPAAGGAAGGPPHDRTTLDGLAPFAHVIHISVDGLRPSAIVTLGPRKLPHFYRLRVEGTFTDNGRTDYDYTVTLPDHACELTSRAVLGPNGHGLTYNSDDGRTLEQVHGSYVAGVFDVIHDHGFNTGMYVSKEKFALFRRSWDADNGAPDTIGSDNGRDKIDLYDFDPNTMTLMDSLIFHMRTSPHKYAFIHLTDLDTVGHAYGWESPEYYAALVGIDGLLGALFNLMDTDPDLAASTAIVLTADHGGTGTDHSDATVPADYTIPLYVWGRGIPAGADLYALNEMSRLDPADGRPTYDVAPQPVRNGEAADLSLELLGLESVPGSTIDAAQNLAVSLPGGAAALPTVSIASPPESTVIDATQQYTVTATAAAGTGAIAAVEFFDNYVKVGDDDTAPYSWTFERDTLGPHRITARARRADGVCSVAGVDVMVVSNASAPAGHSLRLAPPSIVPNPVDRSARIEFSMDRSEPVNIDVYDILGRRVRRLFSGELGRGAHALSFDAGSVAPGLYFVLLRARSGVRAGKLAVVR
jgi:hypothetical protein